MIYGNVIGGTSVPNPDNNDSSPIRFVEITSTEEIEKVDYDQFQTGDIIMFVSSGNVQDIINGTVEQTMIRGE